MKKAAIIVAVLAVLAVGSVFLLPLALSSDGMRAALARQLSEAAGAEIAFNGPIRFSVVPDFGIVIEDMAYRTGDGAVSVTAARSVASVAPLSLFSSQIRITGIELESPRVVLGTVAASPQAPQPAGTASGDVFEMLAGFLERLSIDQVVISNGAVAQSRDGAVTEIAGDVALQLAVPGIDRPASLAVSGVMDGQRLELAADIGSLRDLLGRQPADFSLSTRMEHPPHPLLAELSTSGRIQLAEDGGYHVSGGEVASGGQTMRLDASYVPGERPYVMAKVVAGNLDYSDFQPASAAEGEAGAGGGTPDLSALRGIDADIELRADALRAGEAQAQDVVLAAQLRDGRLSSSVTSGQIAGGSMAAGLVMDVNGDVPQSSGSLGASAIDLQQVLALAGQSAPVSGKLSSDLQYAFRGLDAEAIRNSLNLRGTVSIGEGRAQVPQLAALGTDVVEALEAGVEIENVLEPLSLSGTARWNGENFGFASSLALSDLLWGQAGIVSLDFKSQVLDARFSGTVDPQGSIAGKADVSAASLSRALGWLGQATGTPLGRFSFSGGLSAGSAQLAMSEATIGLDDMTARGSASIALTGKPRITAALAVDRLDFGALTGGGQGGAAAAGSGPAPIDLAMLRLFDADIRLDATEIGYGEVKAGPATAVLSVAGGVAELSVPQAGFYDGAVTAKVTANGAGDVPAIALVAAMDGVEALPLLTTAAGFQHIEGKLKASVEVSGSGADTDAFTRSLTGPVNVVFSNGALRGIDVAGLVRNVQSLIGGSYAANSEAKTEFTELSIGADIRNGVATFPDIRLLGPLVRMGGQGTVDLTARTIDMRLDPRVVASLDGQGGAFDVSGLGMPIVIDGPLAAPRIYPDLTNLLADPNRALQAMSQLGGGIGELANGASGALGGLGAALGDDPSAAADGVMTNLLGQLAGGQAGNGGNGTQPTGQDLFNSLLGGALGTQAPTLAAPPSQDQQPVVEAPATPPPVQTVPANLPLPRPDPRGPAPAMPVTQPAPVTEPAPEPAPDMPAVDEWVPEPAAEENPLDLINSLIQQSGL
ncbi:AsmA family protein [Devosia elaeis]|nr:AsmA family protein [Devosia elaeis]